MSIIDAPSRSHRRSVFRALVFVLLVVLTAGGIWWQRRVDLPPGVSAADYAVARTRFQSQYHREPDRDDVLSLAGELAVGEQRMEAAAACFRAIPTHSVKYGPSARLQQAQIELQLDRAVPAERQFREFLAVAHADRADPAHRRTALKWLAYLYSVQFRLEERRDVLAELHSEGLADMYDSKQFYFPHLLILNSPEGRSRLREFLDRNLHNVMLQTAWARYLTADGRLHEAEEWLERLRAEHSHDPAVSAAWLELCFEKADWSQFATAAAALPEHTSAEPWLLTFLRGQFALHQGDADRAAEMFRAVLADEPAHPGATAGLARAYQALGRDDESEYQLQRSLALAEIRVSLPRVKESDPAAAEELAVLCRRAGLEDAADTFEQHFARMRHSAPLEHRQVTSLPWVSP